MKRFLTWVALGSAVGIAVAWFLSQGGRLLCNSQCVGILLLEPHYRSWRFEFCDFESFDTNGKLVPAIFYYDEHGQPLIKKGRHWPPRFVHVDMSWEN